MKRSFAVICLAVLSCSSAEGNPQKFLNITGMVRDGKSGRPLANAKVTRIRVMS